jgi:hypothetical protein
MKKKEVYVCNNCGAFASSVTKINHFKECRAGNLMNVDWKKIYETIAEEVSSREEYYDYEQY